MAGTAATRTSLGHDYHPIERTAHEKARMSDTETRRIETLSWEDFGRASRQLAQQVADSGYRPDLMVAIARGGLPVGGALAYSLGMKNCAAINVKFYTGIDARLDVPVLLPPTPPLVDLAGLDVLLADDVADSGETLAMVVDMLKGHVNALRTVVLYHKPRSVIVPDYSWTTTSDWIHFPWDEPPVTPNTPPEGD